jgi:two-component system, OmpR family, phosphate regulon sensor histidine kinase PhoR
MCRLDLRLLPAPLLVPALSILLSNASACSLTATTVRLGVGLVTNSSVERRVADRGVGMTAEHLPRLFERFYRVDKARSRDAGGTGLGLALVKHIINVHSGRVEVERAEGKETVFRLILPGASV